jgi:hypothetical protein
MLTWQAYLASGLTAANDTIESGRAAAAQLALLRQRAVDLSLEQLEPGLVEVGYCAHLRPAWVPCNVRLL